ncbi:FtsW/RodA/SpoVE family cell cycle protein [Candidatus Poriferisodalis sp.]|uniref:FtsW/RodA/SpoVE family cell cycle protein n=1 Tax=Candidatus Poriferisodalis sp. TaxID=3101277 RepID=UPI003B012979
MAGVVICTTFAVAALGVEQNSVWGGAGGRGATESLWSSAGWLAAVLAGGAAAHVAIRRWAPNSNETLFGIIGLLMGIGWVFVARVDASLASEQAVAVLLGFAAIAGTSIAARRLDWLLDRPGACVVVAAALLAAGSFSGGADLSAGAYEPPRQWLNLGTMLSVQPYGLAKIVVVIAACGLTATAPRWLRPRFIPHRHVAGASAAAVGAWALLIIGADLASSVIVFAAAWLPLWLDGDDLVGSDVPTVPRSTRATALSGVIISYAVGVVVLTTVYDRLSAQVHYWLNPWTEAEGATVVDAAFAISAGGISGVGPGLGAPQHLHEPHSDFIFAVIAEELGILGGCALLVAFTLLIGVGGGIAQRAHRTHRLLAAAATSVIGLQALLAIADVLRLLPHTVGALPFVAYGPLAMVGNCIAAGLLLAVSNASDAPRAESQQLLRGDP